MSIRNERNLFSVIFACTLSQAHLIGCVSLCLLKCSTIGPDASGDHDDASTQSQEELENIMTSLTERMVKSELDDFELVSDSISLRKWFRLNNLISKPFKTVFFLIQWNATGVKQKLERLLPYFKNGFQKFFCNAILFLM